MPSSDRIDGGLARELFERRVLSAFDWHFARTLTSLCPDAGENVFLATALLSRAMAGGHVCLDLPALTVLREVPSREEETVAVRWPVLSDWLGDLRASSMVACRQRDGDDPVITPLVLSGARLYTRRYWLYERAVAAGLLARSVDVEPALDATAAQAVLERLFGSPTGEIDWQRIAAIVALRRRLCVVSGGPGTGKTHTVSKILALLAEEERAASGRIPDVLLMAPTGKAANRLGESLSASGEPLGGSAQTIHRALGFMGRTGRRFRHDAENPLRADVVVVDEASMVDVSLMAQLLAAVPAKARVILLGDRNQLASVEAGAVLADICGDRGAAFYSPELADYVLRFGGGASLPSAASGPAIRDSIVELRRNYRYQESSGIGRLARAVNAGDSAETLAILQAGGDARLRPGVDGDSELFADAAVAFGRLFDAREPAEKLADLNRFRILAALRKGPVGVEGINLELERRLRASGIVRDDGEMYSGRPIMILRNDPDCELFNGDVGLILGGGTDGMRAYFESGEAVREISLGRLPSFETVFAMSVHKSQGSEFDDVAVVLPDRPSPLMTRELLYTAITRARRTVTIYAAPEIVEMTVRQTVARASGLGERLGWKT